MTNFLKKLKFTLVELLVAMAVFSVFLVIVMQFFSGMQRAWQASNEKGRIISETRVALDLISSMFSTFYFSIDPDVPDSETLFYAAIDEGDKDNAKIYFACLGTSDFPGTGIRYVSLQKFSQPQTSTRQAKDVLVYSMFSNHEKDTLNSDGKFKLAFFFPPYTENGENKTPDRKSYLNKLKRELDIKAKNVIKSPNPVDGGVILNNVIKFNIKAYEFNDTNAKFNLMSSSQTEKKAPYSITLEITVLDYDKYQKWSNPDISSDRKKEIEKNYGHNFKKTFYLGNNWNI